jgi:hypothetical protein
MDDCRLVFLMLCPSIVIGTPIWAAYSLTIANSKDRGDA